VAAGSHQILKLAFVLLTLIGIQFVFGKKASFPYGILMGLKPVPIGAVVLACDLALIPLALAALQGALKIRWLPWWNRQLGLSEARLNRSHFSRYLQSLGKLGLVLVVSIPLSGGVWTGTVISRLLGLKRSENYLYIGLGSLIGCAIFVLSFIGVIHWVS
jgi:uncharacterized membrane protein